MMKRQPLPPNPALEKINAGRTPPGLLAPNELSCDVAVIGGGVGECAAALASARAGKRAILSEETAWIGGRLTSQAVPPDEHGWIESFGCTATYRPFSRSLSATSGSSRQSPAQPRQRLGLPALHEPRVALAVLVIDRDLLEPGFFASDLCLVNWPMIDYMEGDLLTCSPEKGERHLAEFQDDLKNNGVELAWPEDLHLEDGDPHAHAR